MYHELTITTQKQDLGVLMINSVKTWTEHVHSVADKKKKKKKLNVRDSKESNIKQKRRLTLFCHHLTVMNP